MNIAVRSLIGLCAMALASCDAPNAVRADACIRSLQSGTPPEEVLRQFGTKHSAPVSSGMALCEALALHAQGKTATAKTVLESALAGASTSERWVAMGYGAPIYAASNDTKAALRAWDEGVAGATAAKETLFVLIFRDQRAVFNARRGRYADAQRDWLALYDLKEPYTHKAKVALQLAILGSRTGNLPMVERWARLAVRHARERGDVKTERKAFAVLGGTRSDYGDLEGASSAFAREGAAARSAGNLWEEAEAAEMLGQTRYDAGDFRGTESHYRRAIELFEAAGSPDYANYLQGELDSRLSSFEQGNVCVRFLQEQKFEAARRAVREVPEDRRSVHARTCEAEAMAATGDLGGAILKLASEAERASNNSDCQTLIDYRNRLSGDTMSVCRSR